MIGAVKEIVAILGGFEQPPFPPFCSEGGAEALYRACLKTTRRTSGFHTGLKRVLLSFAIGKTSDSGRWKAFLRSSWPGPACRLGWFIHRRKGGRDFRGLGLNLVVWVVLRAVSAW